MLSISLPSCKKNGPGPMQNIQGGKVVKSKVVAKKWQLVARVFFDNLFYFSLAIGNH